MKILYKNDSHNIILELEIESEAGKTSDKLKQWLKHKHQDIYSDIEFWVKNEVTVLPSEIIFWGGNGLLILERFEIEKL